MVMSLAMSSGDVDWYGTMTLKLGLDISGRNSNGSLLMEKMPNKDITPMTMRELRGFFTEYSDRVTTISP